MREMTALPRSGRRSPSRKTAGLKLWRVGLPTVNAEAGDRP